jgi:hypothetical protein
MTNNTETETLLEIKKNAQITCGIARKNRASNKKIIVSNERSSCGR